MKPDTPTPDTQSHAVELLRGLLAIPSTSRHEEQASAWLVEQMAGLGYERAYVDGAGNAVGELGRADAPHTVVLLGHIDTVPGAIPVRMETVDGEAVLYGRGAVDAKGPLATFVLAGARLGRGWAEENHVRLVVVGAVEEEAATSKGARFIRDRFDGRREPPPAACVIGEPSGWPRVTLGYKGRLLVELEAAQPMAHSAGPEAGVATLAVDLWNWVTGQAERFNVGRARAFDQLLPSLRSVNTWTDDTMQDRATAQIGVRLPLDFAANAFAQELVRWMAARVDAAPTAAPQSVAFAATEDQTQVELPGSRATVTLRFHAHEPAWRSDRSSPLVRSFLAAVRTVAPDVKPGFVVKTGTSDMNVVGPAWGCPLVAYGPGDSALDHTPHEHIKLQDFWLAILVLEQALRSLPPLLP